MMPEQKAGGRNLSLDYMRLVLMFMIVCLHVSPSGIHLKPGFSFNQNAFRLIESICIIAVNAFVMLTGYFQCQKSFRFSKLVMLEVQVLFYSVGIYLVAAAAGEETFSFYNFWWSCQPVITEKYWFITAYMLMYALTPILNIVIRSLNRSQHRWLLIIIMAVSFIVNDLTAKTEAVYFNDGYSYIWFFVLYFTGAYIRKYGFDLKHPFVCYLLCTLANFGLTLALVWADGMLSLSEYHTVFAYCSVLNYFSSICLFTFFANAKVSFGGRFISTVRPAVLGVYLIHMHKDVKYRWFSWFKVLRSDSTQILRFFAAVIFLFTLCLLIDLVRVCLFRLIFRKPLLDKIDGVFDRFVSRHINKDST